MATCYQEGAVHLVVAPLLTAVILTYAVEENLVYEVAMLGVVIKRLMIHTLTYVVTALCSQKQVILLAVALFLTSHIHTYAVIIC